jgi:hypothetical protein
MPLLERYIQGFVFILIFAFLNFKISQTLFRKKKILVFLMPLIVFIISGTFIVYTQFSSGWDPIFYYVFGVAIFGLGLISLVGSLIIFFVEKNIKKE